ncbi:MAG TPA: hypothetical protein VFF06_28440 [Polyangia bacterium]|nr:hypothetical protein [Polyangia bacterium]
MFKRIIGVALVASAISCSPTTQSGTRHDLAGTGGNGDGGGMGDDAGGTGDDASMSMMADLLSLDGPPGMAYDDLGKSDSGLCAPPMMGATCPNPIAVNAGCGAVELCGTDGTGNGTDDNCDGVVDEGCVCTPGDVKKCFLGPPGKRGVGQCTDGSMTCQGAEFGSWGPCGKSIGPSAEACDNLDNDCNGCADDGLCCGGILNCPGPGDPRIAPAQPYTNVNLKGELFFGGSAASWKWTVTGGPCDQLFATTTGNPPVQSFTLTGANTQDAVVHFTLSGDYTVTMTVVGTDGQTYTCTWVQHIIGPGVRFELCWDHTGGSSAGGADLDLHVHKSGTTTAWFGASPGSPNTDDCDYDDCNPDSYNCTPFPPLGITCPSVPVANWYPQSALAECSGAPATQGGSTWSGDNMMNGNLCPNPRLDVDNIDTVGRPENVNIDAPKDGDSFRAMVHYYGQDGSTSTNNVEQHPIVNVYCGGTLKATYGQTPNTLGPCPGATCFNKGQGWAKGQMWRVADVKAIVTGGVTTDCTVTPIHPPAALSGYYVTTNNTAF